MRCVFFRRAPRELPVPESGGGTGNAWAAVGGVWLGGGSVDAGLRTPRSSAGLRVGGVRAPRQRPKWGTPLRSAAGSPGACTPLCPAASQLRAGEAAGDRTRGSGRVRVSACRVLPSDPGVQMLAQLPQEIPLGH